MKYSEANPWLNTLFILNCTRKKNTFSIHRMLRTQGQTLDVQNVVFFRCTVCKKIQSMNIKYHQILISLRGITTGLIVW